jgi:hypothetical protein
VLCGEGSADLYFQQVGLQVGERLGMLPYAERHQQHRAGRRNAGGRAHLDDEIEVLEVPLPAALSVTTDITSRACHHERDPQGQQKAGHELSWRNWQVHVNFGYFRKKQTCSRADRRWPSIALSSKAAAVAALRAGRARQADAALARGAARAVAW